MRPVFWLTSIPPGPLVSPHWRSRNAGLPGSVSGTGAPNDAPPSVDVSTNMFSDALPLPALWNSR
jgi:hypothetical protein